MIIISLRFFPRKKTPTILVSREKDAIIAIMKTKFRDNHDNREAIIATWRFIHE
jgi:hypothetical protein